MPPSVNRAEHIFGKLIVAAFAAYLLVHFNYEISQYLISRWDAWWNVRYNLSADWQSYMEDANLIVHFLMLIVWLVLYVASALLLLVVAGAVAIAGKLNEVYVLPFILAVLIVYSKFSYVYIARPFLLAIRAILRPLGGFLHLIRRGLELFVILPFVELFLSRRSGTYRMYRVSTSIIFLTASTCFFLGVAGVASYYANKYQVFGHAGRLVDKARGLFDKPQYATQQFQLEFQVNHPHWTSTGILVHPGDQISVTASGRGSFPLPGIFSYKVGGAPDGIEWIAGRPGQYILPRSINRRFYRYGYALQNFLLCDDPICGLMGQIGTADPFYIGTRCERRVSVDGELLLAINQMWGGDELWAQNEGTFYVTVVVGRRQANG